MDGSVHKTAQPVRYFGFIHFNDSNVDIFAHFMG